MLESGHEYRPASMRTDAGTIRLRLQFRKPWPWFIIGAAAVAAALTLATQIKIGKGILFQYASCAQFPQTHFIFSSCFFSLLIVISLKRTVIPTAYI